MTTAPGHSKLTDGCLRALLLAPPGAGKGTQGARLALDYGVPLVSTGELLRAEVAANSDIGRAATAYMDRGELVPDDVVQRLVYDRVAVHNLDGFILDGFPRTLRQAETAHRWGEDHGRALHAAITIDVPEDELVRRVLARGRRTGRSDDTAETVRQRLNVYETHTRPLLDFYDQRRILRRVDGTGAVEDITRRIHEVIDALGVR